MSVNRLITLPHQRYVKTYKKKTKTKQNIVYVFQLPNDP